MSHTHDRDRLAANGSGPPTDEVPVDERTIRILAGIYEGTVAEESDLSTRGTSPAEVEAELREIHLPKLDAAGYIEWDPESGEIEKGPRFEELALELEWSDWDDAPDG
ncbi:hypothetical protein [Halorubrum vacuolatum]|uniref:Transcriptional regulator n=1 Tax=Halorubrum vacuolatum TaxID=63740 RepID=A0A238VBL5_HALVU|nr:hypothetical protein [Halorubrum vacuolatum]SNR31802.1 hypothetical protein SAMN06264855_102227 [Halorubrum vacuolatum]